MNRSFVSLGLACLASFAFACGGQTTSPTGEDAGVDASPDATGPIEHCNGYCPQSNGAVCQSDCDCFNKCLSGTDKPARCADPIAPTVACGDSDGSTCPAGQQCDPFGTCEGAPCGSNDDCPTQQQCLSGACSVTGCI